MADNGTEEIKIQEDGGAEETKTTENEEGVKTPEVDIVALSELISDKDKELQQLKGEIDQLKKANAQMVVQLTAGKNTTEDIGQMIVNFCDTRKA